ncbi:MAG: glycosyltransferase family 1 protein [Sphaerobacter sp.]|nr:glycosyltransferase family 1 protein [Sphaerobacter sp.]
MRVGILGHLLTFAPGYRQAGVSRYIEFLLRALPSAAPDIQPVVFSGPQADGGVAELPRNVQWRRSRLPTGRPEVRILWEQLAGPVALRRAGVDLVHGPVNVLPLADGLPGVVTVHDLAFRVYPEQYPRAKQRYLDLLTGASIRRAARVITVSESTRRDVLRLYPVDPSRVVTVPNGVDPSMAPVTDPARLRAFREARGLPDEFLLFVGTLQPRKNLTGLLRAYAAVRDRVAAPLVVAGGKGWMYEPIFAEVRALGIEGRVIFAGYADAAELPLWYSAATAFVYPSLYEGFGLPVLEAMACGTPVITSDTSSLPEVAGDAALLVDPRDVDALAAGIERIMGDAPLRATLRARGLARARAFSWERTARETAAVYRAALGADVVEERSEA